MSLLFGNPNPIQNMAKTGLFEGKYEVMDDILTEFVSRTQSDAALAHDLLEAAGWNLDAALAMYDGFYSTQAVQPEDEIPPELYSRQSDRDHYERGGGEGGGEGWERGEEGEGEGNDTLTALDASFETRRDMLRSKQDSRAARGLSFLADDIVDRFHKVAISKHRVSQEEQTVIDDQFFRHSFVYPDFSSLDSGLQEFIAADLIDISLRTSLEKTNRLNWWTHSGKFPRLEPLATSGDGNCLLHAASLYMWGFHDRFLLLRTSMHRLLTQSRECSGIQSRWRYQTQLRNDEAGGLTFSEDEWAFEWSEVVRIATNRPREQAALEHQRKSSLRLSFEYLEEIHIFALAHVTQRPIIVVADTTLKGVSGEDLAPIYFGGVYLPLEMNPTACHKSPVVLAYDAAHFSALVAKEEKPQQQSHVGFRQAKVLQGRGDRKREEPVVPLVGPDGCLLPIQFVYNPKNPTVREKWGQMKYERGEFPPELIRLLESYLNIRWVKLPVLPPAATESSSTEDYDHLASRHETIRCPAAHLGQETQPVYQKDLIDMYLANVQERFEEEKRRCQRVAEERERQVQLEEEARQRQPVPCKGPGCEMYGTLSSGGLCSVCYQKSLAPESDESETEKVDLAMEPRELDNETVELYMPSIEQHPPSYETATGDGELWERGGEGEGVGMNGEQSSREGLSNGLANSDSSSTGAPLSKRDPSPQLLPSPNTVEVTGSGGHQQDALGYSSSSTSLHSSASEGSRGGGGGDKSPKKSRGGWVKKKLQALPGGLRTKPKKAGQAQDKVQPISYAKTSSDRTIPCRNGGCEFSSSPNCDGYCSTCYKASKTIATTLV